MFRFFPLKCVCIFFQFMILIISVEEYNIYNLLLCSVLRIALKCTLRCQYRVVLLSIHGAQQFYRSAQLPPLGYPPPAQNSDIRKHSTWSILNFDILVCLQITICDVIGFCSSWTEFFSLLGYYAAYDGLKLTFREYLSVPSSRIKLFVLDGLTLEDGRDK